MADASSHADLGNPAGHAASDANVRDIPHVAEAANLARDVKAEYGPALTVSLGATELRGK
jgi:hypothetical protein